MSLYTVHNLPHHDNILKYSRELCYTLNLTQALYAQNDKENGVDFNNMDFPEEARICLGFMNFRAPSAALKLKNYHNSPSMQPIITLFQVLVNFIKRHI